MPEFIDEKHPSGALPTWNPEAPVQTAPKKSTQFGKALCRILATLALGYIAYGMATEAVVSWSGNSTSVKAPFSQTCQQSPAIFPQYANLTDVYKADTKDRIISWHTGAVKIPTQNYDEMGAVGEDPRWDVFGDFHAYLEKSYPLVYKTLSVEKVLTYGLVFEWQGSDTEKKPLMLTGHQDVVPVNPATINQWTYPPFSGHVEDGWIYGRGGGDDKSGLIGIMSALELLIESGFKPSRSLVISFGFDEETGGNIAARALNKHITAKYGPDSMFMLVDEGNGIVEQYGQMFAAPAVGEKGKFDARIEVLTPGGHSSVPPPHTGIGILAQAIVELENHPVAPKLSRENPLFAGFQCAAETGNMPKDWTSLIKRATKSDRALKKLTQLIAKKDALYRATVSTTRAVDLVSGGVKVNALPELSMAVANHRINADSSVAELQEQLISVITPLAKKLDLSFEAFNQSILSTDSHKGLIRMSQAFDSALEPAPISPHDISSPAWNLLSGSVKATYSSRKNPGDDTDIKMMPGLAIGNTDTRRYWDLTRNIHRFGYLVERDLEGIHTVDERVRVDAIIEIVRFFEHLILNVDEYSE